MEEIIFWLIFCGQCEKWHTHDGDPQIRECDDENCGGHIVCPDCGQTHADSEMLSICGSTFNGLSQETLYKLLSYIVMRVKPSKMSDELRESSTEMVENLLDMLTRAE